MSSSSKKPKDFQDFLQQVGKRFPLKEMAPGIWEFRCPCGCGKTIWAKDGGNKVKLFDPANGQEIED